MSALVFCVVLTVDSCYECCFPTACVKCFLFLRDFLVLQMSSTFLVETLFAVVMLNIDIAIGGLYERSATLMGHTRSIIEVYRLYVLRRVKRDFKSEK